MLAAISPQTPEVSSSIIENGSLAFPVLSAPSNSLARELGILTEPNAEARAAHTEVPTVLGAVDALAVRSR